MKYDVLYQRREDRVPMHGALSTNDLAKAVRYCQALSGPLNEYTTIHYTITCEDGRTLFDTRKQAPLAFGDDLAALGLVELMS